MALLSYSFLTIDEVQRHLRVPAPSTDELATMEMFTDAIVDRFEQEIGRQIVARPITEMLDGNGTLAIQPSRFPIQSVTALVAIDTFGATIYTYDHTTVSISEWGRVMLSGGVGLLPGQANIRITYSQGFATVPADLKAAALQWIARLYRDWKTDREPIASQSVQGVSTAYLNEAMPKFVQGVLARYAIPGASA